MASETEAISSSKDPMISVQLVLIQLLLFVLLAIALEKPVGSIAGHLALQQEGFTLYSSNIRGSKVYAIANGPRGKENVERGVWINPDGSFKIDQLPVGEYSLTVRFPGFSTFFESGIFVDEGKITKLKDPITLSIAYPSVNIASNSRVFTTAEPPRFWMNASGASKANIKIYRQDLLSFIAKAPKGQLSIGGNMDFYNSNFSPKEFFGNNTPVKEWSRNLTSDIDDWAHEQFKCETPLPAGDYVVASEVSDYKGQTAENILWFSVSDLGLLIKQDGEKTLVRAINLKTLSPEPDTKISLYNYKDGKIKTNLGSAETNVNGFSEIAAGGTNDYIVCGNKGSNHAYGGMSYYADYQTKSKVYFYTDRSVYRLGQTVCYKGIVRTGDLKNLGANQTIGVAIEDPDNNKIWSGELSTNKFGTFHGVFPVPNGGKIGAYQVAFNMPDGSTDYERFEVAEYRKPEYQVDVIPLKPQVIAGSKAKVRIKANYYFGAPVTNAKVKYSIYASSNWALRAKLSERPDYYGFFDSWYDDESYDDSGYGGDFISEGYAQTDSTGEAIVEFDTQANKNDLADSNSATNVQDKTYRVEAEVTDLSRISVLGNGSISAVAGDFALFVEPENYVYKVGEPISASFRTVKYDNTPASNVPVKVQLLRYKWDNNNKEKNNRGTDVFETATVTTDNMGHGKVTFQTKSQYPTDVYYIVGQCQDSAHHNIADSNSIWIASQNYPYALSDNSAEKEPLSLKLDKAVYKPGEKAKLMIIAPVTGKEGSQAIVAIEGDKLYEYRSIDLKATAQLIEIPILSSYAPNVFVSITFVGSKHQFYNQTKLIKVSPDEHFLALDINCDKKQYKPGETAKYTVKAKYANGKPARNTEVSLALVDESIFAIRPDPAADIKKYFYPRRSNSVITLCSFPEEYSGGPDKIGSPRVRKDFKDTAAWLPNLVTDENGIATASIKLPDNLTTWRATVRGVDLNTNIGSTINKVISTQDLIVRLALPRFFTIGDEGMVTAIVHNYSGTGQNVDLDLVTSKQLSTGSSLHQQLKVESDKAMRFSWPVKVISSGQSLVSIKAIGKTASDAMETKVPVRPLGLPMLLVKGGILEDNNKEASIDLLTPDGIDANSVKYQIHLSSSSLSSAVSNFATLIDYPYGCTEQTMSRLMPSVAAMRLHKSLGAPLAQTDIKKFNDVYKQAMTKLYQYQHSDGGWGWWQNDLSAPYLTALVMEGYYYLNDAGYSVDKTSRDKGKAWIVKNANKFFLQFIDPLRLKNEYGDSDAMIDLSRMYYVLSLYNEKIPNNVKTWILKHKEELTPEALSYFSMALKKENDQTNASLIYKRLLDLANHTESTAGNSTSWEITPQLAKKLKLTSNYYSYRFTPVETTALALTAAVRIDPSNSELIESIKNWILTQRGKDGWGSTKTTAQVIEAFIDEELLHKTNKAVNFKTTVALDNSSQTFSFSEANRFKPEQEFTVSGQSIKKAINITKTGNGRLYYTATLNYYQPLKPQEKVASWSSPKGLNITRQFFRINASQADSNGNIHLKAEKLPDNPTVNAGETVLMKVYVDSPTQIPYTILDAALPSGGEVVSDSAKEEESQSDMYKYDSEFVSPWWTHEDILDDRIVYFVSSFPRSKAAFSALLRMELPGKFQINPITLEGMYTQDIKAHSPLNTIEVKE